MIDDRSPKQAQTQVLQVFLQIWYFLRPLLFLCYHWDYLRFSVFAVLKPDAQDATDRGPAITL
jgi:hypothetical protein